TYTADGVFRVRIYDNFKKQIPVAGFRGRVVLTSERGVPLTPARDGQILTARVGALGFPAELTLLIVLARGSSEERFDFVFVEPSPSSQ
ncbi:MAG: hypothetical protein ACRD2N_20820, partial [Vicinamibacterales bacterium]